MKKLFALFALMVLLCGCTQMPETEQTVKLVLRYADNQSADYPTTVAAHFFADLVEEQTEGQIRIRVYCDGELGDELSTLEQLRFGGIDMARLSTGTLTEQNEELTLLTMPYLYEDADHMWRVLDGPIGKRFLDSVSSSGILGLSWYDAGARSFYTSTPINRLEDLEGLRIRVQESESMRQMVTLLGAVAQPLAYDQVYAALFVSKVDGAENNLPSYMSAGHSRLAPYFLQDEHSRLPEMQVMSAAARDKIAAVNEDYLDVVVKCARESAKYERILWQERMAQSRVDAARAGVTFTELDADELQKFRNAVRPLYDALPQEKQELVEQIRNS